MDENKTDLSVAEEKRPNVISTLTPTKITKDYVECEVRLKAVEQSKS